MALLRATVRERRTTLRSTNPTKPVKTTILGILTIIAAVANATISFLKTGTADYGVLVAAVTAGIGLLKAADHIEPPTPPAE